MQPRRRPRGLRAARGGDTRGSGRRTRTNPGGVTAGRGAREGAGAAEAESRVPPVPAIRRVTEGGPGQAPSPPSCLQLRIVTTRRTLPGLFARLGSG